MKIKNFIPALLFFALFTDTSIYDIEVDTPGSSKPISLAQYRGYKLLITTVPAGKESKEKIDYLLSLLRDNNKLRIIAVPTHDEKLRKAAGETVSLTEIGSASILVTKPVNVLKQSGYEQHALFKWLTSSKLNGHFDAERETTAEYFLISDDGLLYAVLPAAVPKPVLEEALRSGGKE